MVMEVTELCLAATHDDEECVVEKSRNSCMSEISENNPSRKRKHSSDQLLIKSTSATSTTTGPAIQTSVDLQLKDPLPLDWEQCLDLQSGRMYYMNRKTLRKSWNWPENNKQKLDLELNMSSTLSNSSLDHLDHDHHEYSNKHHHQYSSSGNNNNMVALACLNCHLLVILSKSSPSCPNCKYVHSFPTLQTQPPNFSSAPNSSPNTLSLLKY
ncbi:hypothetical protein EZV62_001478 [Acer yangbiense]|uniref:WW domain-containing protein n=1 Tax=Acer yangbiense TaxID=1000413 RepID=A0A5C7IUY9_9ROSI|nr:hypothetical protein EZV62_001478 [Acer yangbiense]